MQNQTDFSKLNIQKDSLVFVVTKEILADETRPITVLDAALSGGSIRAVFTEKDDLQCFYVNDALEGATDAAPGAGSAKISAPFFILSKNADHKVKLSWDVEKLNMSLFVDDFEIQVHTKIGGVKKGQD